MEFIWCLMPPEFNLNSLTHELIASNELPNSRKFYPLLGLLTPIQCKKLDELSKDSHKCSIGGYDYCYSVNGTCVRLCNWIRFVTLTSIRTEANLEASIALSGSIEFTVAKTINKGEVIKVFDGGSNSTNGVSVPHKIQEQDVPLDLRKFCAHTSKKSRQAKQVTMDEPWRSSSLLYYRKKMESIRKRDKPMLPCSVCQKTFDRPSLLKRHMRTHTGEKPHECDICGKAFSTSSSLNTHRRIHSGERPHQCNICLKRFTASSNLYYHRMTHIKEKPHKCTQCGKSFPTPGDLRSHTYVHTGSWPFRCPICSRGFSKQTNMRNHLFLHTGKKPHSCLYCGKCFALACNLRAHLRIHEEASLQKPPINEPSDTSHLLKNSLASTLDF